MVRFGVVGSFNTALDFVLLNLLYQGVGLPALVANTISVTIGITISYLLNHRVVFRHPHKISLSAYLRFFVVTGLSVVVIQDAVIYVVTRIIHIDPTQVFEFMQLSISAEALEVNLAKVLAVGVGMVWNYSLYKFLVFRHHGDPTDEIPAA